MLSTQSDAAQRVADLRSRVMDLNSALLTELAHLPTNELDAAAQSCMVGAVVKMQGAANDLGRLESAMEESRPPKPPPATVRRLATA